MKGSIFTMCFLRWFFYFILCVFVCMCVVCVCWWGKCHVREKFSCIWSYRQMWAIQHGCWELNWMTPEFKTSVTKMSLRPQLSLFAIRSTFSFFCHAKILLNHSNLKEEIISINTSRMQFKIGIIQGGNWR